MDPRTPTWPNSPTPTQNCSRLQQLAKEVDQYSTFKRGQQLTIDALKAPGVYDTETPYVKELLNSLYELLDLHPRARKERLDGFTMPPHSKASKINNIDNQLNFQIELGNKFSVLSQETAENLTTELASTTNQNIVIAPPPTENLLNAPTPNSNAPKPNYVPLPIMLKVTETYKQQMKVITDSKISMKSEFPILTLLILDKMTGICKRE
ncbi:hypothetical protein TNCV_3980531 [Trichonephila clavipes]|nr:hypothetical protein TNCV_3980531 [Trichonephila clavipes]